MNARAARWVLAGGLTAGTLDIVYACVFWALKAGAPAQRIFQSVAAGLLGQASFSGGNRTAALGLTLHYLMTLAMAAAYYVAARYRPVLARRAWLGGAAYGVLLYCFMNYVVVPLSAASASPKDPLWMGLSIAMHVLLVGIPCALCARAALRRAAGP